MNKIHLKIPSEAGDRLKKEGFFFYESIIKKDDLIEINKELNEWKNIPAVNGYGCLYHDSDALLQNLSIYSPAALRLALSEDLLDFMERHFGEKVILSKIEYRRALVPKPKMPLHSDNSKEVLIFVYLNGASKSLGATAAIPGTHTKGVSLNDGYLQIPKRVEDELGLALVPVEGGPGTCLFFEANVWHSRLESTRSGREIIWIAYTPLSLKNKTVNLVFSRRSLIGLTNRQMDALALGMDGLENKFSEEFRLSRSQHLDNLSLLSNIFIIKALFYNIYMSIRQSIPVPIKKILRKILRSNTIKPKYKKIS